MIIHVDNKHSIWERATLKLKGDEVDIEQLKKDFYSMNKKDFECKYDIDDYEFLFDTADQLYPKDNGGESTRELYFNEDIIATNTDESNTEKIETCAKFHYRLDHLDKVWARTDFSSNDAPDVVVKNFKEMDRSDFEKMYDITEKHEYMYDTIQEMKPSENKGEDTVQIFNDDAAGEKIFGNAEKYEAPTQDISKEVTIKEDEASVITFEFSTDEPVEKRNVSIKETFKRVDYKSEITLNRKDLEKILKEMV